MLDDDDLGGGSDISGVSDDSDGDPHYKPANPRRYATSSDDPECEYVPVKLVKMRGAAGKKWRERMFGSCGRRRGRGV